MRRVERGSMFQTSSRARPPTTPPPLPRQGHAHSLWPAVRAVLQQDHQQHAAHERDVAQEIHPRGALWSNQRVLHQQSDGDQEPEEPDRRPSCTPAHNERRTRARPDQPPPLQNATPSLTSPPRNSPNPPVSLTLTRRQSGSDDETAGRAAWSAPSAISSNRELFLLSSAEAATVGSCNNRIASNDRDSIIGPPAMRWKHLRPAEQGSPPGLRVLPPGNRTRAPTA